MADRQAGQNPLRDTTLILSIGPVRPNQLMARRGDLTTSRQTARTEGITCRGSTSDCTKALRNTMI